MISNIKVQYNAQIFKIFVNILIIIARMGVAVEGTV
jgi:hypothetical protein